MDVPSRKLAAVLTALARYSGTINDDTLLNKLETHLLRTYAAAPSIPEGVWEFMASVLVPTNQHYAVVSLAFKLLAVIIKNKDHYSIAKTRELFNLSSSLLNCTTFDNKLLIGLLALLNELLSHYIGKCLFLS